MTEAEFWFEKLSTLNLNELKVSKKTGEPTQCSFPIPGCSECLFNDHKPEDIFGCARKRIRWLISEHKERPKLTKRERAFCEFVGIGYIVRDGSGYISHYTEKPKKLFQAEVWYSNVGGSMQLSKEYKNIFPFIRWENDEPWAVEDLLELEVEDEPILNFAPYSTGEAFGREAKQ